MRWTKRSAGSIFLAAAMVFSFPVCHAGGAGPRDAVVSDQGVTAGRDLRVYENNGFRLSVPKRYDRLLVVDRPADGGRLFTVSEKKSIEADRAQGGSGKGAGWLFGIGTVSEIQLYEMLQSDMSGAEIFARGDDGIYYVYYHPTDVRLVRKDYGREEDMKEWTMLNTWAYDTVRKSFLADNPGLTAETYGNADLDMNLARAAFSEGTQYTVSTSERGLCYPTVVSPVPYAMRLMRNAHTETLDAVAEPAGDYVVLNFPDEDVRYDFFLAEGSENIYRKTWSKNKQLFKITFADGRTKASAVMKQWYDALAGAEAMRELGYRTDDLLGQWAEKIAGRGAAAVAVGAKGMYDVRIEWPDGAARRHIWEMTARPAGAGSALYYTNGRHILRSYEADGRFAEEVLYQNGTGRFYLNSAYELMWEDDMEDAVNGVLFVRTD